MRIRYGPTLCILLAFAACVGAADAPIRLPELPKLPDIPTPMPGPDTPTKLLKGQFYVVASPVPLVVDSVSGDGSVTIAGRKGPLMLPAELAVGYKPDANDPEFVTFTEPYLYLVKAGAKSGNVNIEIIPALNEVDDKGKQIPLKRSDIIKRTVLVDSGNGPQPPPKPPTPIDPPKPVDPAPIPVAGLRVLIVYDQAALPKVGDPQHAILYGAKFRSYLDVACVVGDDGMTKEYRFWPSTVDTKEAPKLWQDVFKRERKSIPWLVVSNGVTGCEIPLPANVDDAIATIKKYEGK